MIEAYIIFYLAIVKQKTCHNYNVNKAPLFGKRIKSSIGIAT